MIVYVKAIQDAYKTKAHDFGYNTYILFALVIFFLEMKYELPAFDVPKSTYKPIDDNLKYLAVQFYILYAMEYVPCEHILCPRFNKCYSLTELKNGKAEDFKDKCGKTYGPYLLVCCLLYVQAFIKR